MNAKQKWEISGDIKTACKACGEEIEITDVVCGECTKQDAKTVQNTCQQADANLRSIRQVMDDAAMRMNKEILIAGDIAADRYDAAKKVIDTLQKKADILEKTIEILNSRVKKQAEQIAAFGRDAEKLKRSETESERALREWGEAIEASFVADISEDLDEDEHAEANAEEYLAQARAKQLALRLAREAVPQKFGGERKATKGKD